MKMKLALANIIDSRDDFFTKRKPLVDEEIKSIQWLRDAFDICESGVIKSSEDINRFAQEVTSFNAHSLIVHFPIWGDPIFTVKLANLIRLPILLMGNSRPETSSIVGLLGAGGALDQIGCKHVRVFDDADEKARNTISAFVQAADTINQLRGKTLGLFGGRSLGIFTATADPAQWQNLFGVDIEYIDQAEIVKTAEALPVDEVEQQKNWFLSRIGGVQYSGLFTPKNLERQVRSYIATNKLVAEHKIDFVGVKCQPELSDGYVSQCIAHMLMNGNVDASGEKDTIVHACESDSDGALTMQILHLLSGGKPVSLMDIRWFDPKNNLWTFANCGAIPAAFCATKADPSGLSNVRMEAHVFGKGGGALPAIVQPQKVTMARLCRKNGEYWMAILSGQVESVDPIQSQQTTPVFPKAFVRILSGTDFLNSFGSNHLHLISGDFVEKLVMFCRLTGIRYEIWN